MKRGGGFALMHVYEWEHVASLYYRTAKWMFTKLGRDEVLLARHMHKDVLDIFANIWGGGPFLKKLLLQKATATNRIHLVIST